MRGADGSLAGMTRSTTDRRGRIRGPRGLGGPRRARGLGLRVEPAPRRGWRNRPPAGPRRPRAAAVACRRFAAPARSAGGGASPCAPAP